MTAILAVKSVTDGQARGELGHAAVNVGKTLPASTTGNLFVVTGTIVCSLVGVVSTVLSLTAVSPTIGITGSPAVIAAAPSVAYASTAVGSVITMPASIGGALPAPITVAGVSQEVGLMEVSNTTITITTGSTNTGAITWILMYASLYPKHNASVANG
jgi:hypothetical protein